MYGIQHNPGNGDGDEHHEQKQTTGTLPDRTIEETLSVTPRQSNPIADDLRKSSMRSTPPHPSQIPSRSMVPSASTPPRTRQTSGALESPPNQQITMDMSKEELFENANTFQRLYYEALDHMNRQMETLGGICAMQRSQLQQQKIRAQAAGVDLEDPRPAGVPSVPGSQVVSRTGSRQPSGFQPSISSHAGNVFANRDPFTEGLRKTRSVSQGQGRLSLIGSPTDKEGSVPIDASARKGSNDSAAVAVTQGEGSVDGRKTEGRAPISILPPTDDIPPSPPQSELQTHMAGRTPPPQILRINTRDLSGVQTPLAEALQIDGQIDLPDDPALSGPLTLKNKPDAGQDTLNALDEALAKVANEPEKNPPAATLSQGSTQGTAESARPQAPKGTEVTATAHGDMTSDMKVIMGGAGSSPSQNSPQIDGGDDEPDIKLKTRTDTTNFGLPLGQVKKRFPSGAGNTRGL